MTTELDSVGIYLKDLDKLPQMTSDQLEVWHRMLHSGGAWTAESATRVLWGQACLLVPVIEGRIRKAYGIEHADPDLLQEGNMACYKAIQTWDPAQGAFTTWIGHAVRGALLDYLNEQGKGGVGSKAADVTMVDMQDAVAFSAEQTGTEDRPGMGQGFSGISRGDLLTYSGVNVGDAHEGAEYIPEGFDQPDREAYRQQLREALMSITDPLDRLILTNYYGFDGPAKTLQELADITNYSVTGVRKRLLAAQEKVKKWV